MTKSIRSYPEKERKNVIARRLQHRTDGLGYLAAVDAQKHQGQVKKVEVVEDLPEENLDKQEKE